MSTHLREAWRTVALSRVDRFIELLRDVGTVDVAKMLWDDDFNAGDIAAEFDYEFEPTEAEVAEARRRISAESQANLRSKFGDTLTVYRSGPVPDQPVSTSLSKHTATTFGEPVEYTISVRDVLYYSEALWRHGTFAEEEVGVMGNDLLRSKTAKLASSVQYIDYPDEIVLVVDGERVGHINWSLEQDQRVFGDDWEQALGDSSGYYAKVKMLVVHPEHRRKGYATLLFDRFVEQAQRQFGPKGWHSGEFTPDGVSFWKTYRGEDVKPSQRMTLGKVASRTVTLYHGTNQAALDAIRRDGEFRKMDPEAVNHEIEKRYNLPHDSVWLHKYNTFSHGRVSDPHVYFSGNRSTAVQYAMLGSEVVWDALHSVVHILHWDEMVDEEGDYRPGAAEWRKAWISEEVRKHYQPVVLTLEVPWDKPYEPDNTEMLTPPIPASWITKVETL